MKKLSHSESSKRRELLIKSDNVTRPVACTYTVLPKKSETSETIKKELYR